MCAPTYTTTGTHLEISTLREDGALVLEKTFGLYGRIACLEYYRPASLTQDVLFIFTDKKHFSVLGWDNDGKKIVVRATGNLRDRSGKDIDGGPRVLMEPSNRMIGVLVYNGQLKVRLDG
jgi:DNA damage-binding protein 1